MSDRGTMALVVFTFALVATTHVAIVFGLLARPPRWRALAAAVVLPLAPYLALREGMRVRCTLWLIAAATYLVLLAIALRS